MPFGVPLAALRAAAPLDPLEAAECKDTARFAKWPELLHALGEAQVAVPFWLRGIQKTARDFGRDHLHHHRPVPFAGAKLHAHHPGIGERHRHILDLQQPLLLSYPGWVLWLHRRNGFL